MLKERWIIYLQAVGLTRKIYILAVFSQNKSNTESHCLPQKSLKLYWLYILNENIVRWIYRDGQKK